MKKLFIFLNLIFFFANIGFGCTTFLFENNGHVVFGRNYDWATGTGMVYTNARGINKHALVIDGTKTFRWTSNYSSVTFNQYGKEFPNGGMNEKGLVVEVMWLSESEYAKPDERYGLTVLQWVQYQLDHASTIDDVIAADKNLRIVSAGAPLHFLVADASGKAATIEFLDGAMVVHRSTELPYPVLANSTYKNSIHAVNNLKKGIKNLDNSTTRFATACATLQQYKQGGLKENMIPNSFSLLDKVAQGDFTKWSIVYDITNKKIHFKTYGYEQIKTIDANALSFSCDRTLAFDMNQKASGNINNLFINYNNGDNSRMLFKAFRESKAHVNIDEQLQRAIAAMPEKFTCTK